MMRYIHFGISKLFSFFRIVFIIRDYFFFRSKSGRCPRFPLRLYDLYPCIGEKTKETTFDRHYIYHPAWAARVLAETRPEVHVDISSTLYFSAIISAFISVKFYDYRPARLELTNLTSEHADLLNLPFPDGSIRSLSCMHAVEHVGLGRYGDSIDPEGDLKAIKELGRVLASGGTLLFVVPVGEPRIQFNAHRIYSYRQIIDAFHGLTLKQFTLIPQREHDGGLVLNATEQMVQKEKYGCGCFKFTK